MQDSRGREEPRQQIGGCEGGKRIYKRWKTAGGRDVQALHDRESRGGEAGATEIEVKRCLTVTDGGEVVCRSGGGTKYPKHGCNRWCGDPR